MLTEKQRKEYLQEFKNYKKKYLVEKYMNLDESATRLMINYFLSKVLGFEELDEIKTEHAIKGTYADYVIQLDHKQHLVVEVKAIQIKLSDKHIRQAIGYAANEGIDWVLLTNGKEWQLYRVIFGKPLTQKLVFSVDLTIDSGYKKAILDFEYLTKKCVSNGDLELFWKRHIAIDPKNMCKHLYSYEAVKLMRKMLKNEVGINFSENEIFNALHNIITTEIESEKPKLKIPLKKVISKKD